MTREQANIRLEKAIAILKKQGWTDRNIEAAFDGLHREDAVESAERYAGIA